MDKAHHLSSLMVVNSLDLKKDPFYPREKGEELLSHEVPYLNVICVLMYLANCTRPFIVFFYQFISQVQFCSYSKILEWFQTYITLPLRNN